MMLRATSQIRSTANQWGQRTPGGAPAARKGGLSFLYAGGMALRLSPMHWTLDQTGKERLFVL